MKKTFAIETSCDDTSIGVVTYENGRCDVEKLLAYSQIIDHQKFGWVVPEVAYRLHSEKIIHLIEAVGLEHVESADSISVTTHPGLGGSLLVGKTAAEMLGRQYSKKVLGVNHVYGHIFSLLLERNVKDLPFPWVVLTASGGHNEIYLVNYEGEISEDTLFLLSEVTIAKLGQTLDDAAGECFDKVARMLGGPYPGGARIGEKATRWAPNERFAFKRIFLDRDKYEFSFSGMKSQVHHLLSTLEKEGVQLDVKMISDIAYEFQEAVVEVLGKKLIQAAHEFGAKSIGIVGGVSANDRLFEYTTEFARKRFSAADIDKTEANTVIIRDTFDGQNILVMRPMKKVYSTDNAAMIGVVWLLSA